MVTKMAEKQEKTDVKQNSTHHLPILQHIL